MLSATRADAVHSNPTTAKESEQELVAIAKKVLPAGSLGNVASHIVLDRGHGSHAWDVSGTEYIDYLIGSGPMLIGHCHPAVTAAVTDQLAKGATFFLNNAPSIHLAQELVASIPCAEKVRYVTSGSEAVAYALRVARAFRGRDKVLKFEGGYHGMSDYSLMSLEPKKPGEFPTPVPDSAGIPASIRSEVLVSAFNDIEMAESLIKAHHKELGAVIVEPLQRVIPPSADFLQRLRAITTRYEIPLIFDEIVTGFRLSYGGAQQFYGVTPDLCSVGKVVGGGFALAAIAGRADIMAHFDEAAVGAGQFVKQVGTLSGNPVAAVAGLETLRILKQPGTYEDLFATGRALMDGMSEIIKKAGLDAQIVGVPPLFDVVYTKAPITDYRSILKSNRERQTRINQRLRAAGILKAKTKYYLSTAHTHEDVEQTLRAFAAAVASE